MVKFFFKSVGQGDSIVVEWEVDDELNIGIIDCSRIKGGNPTLEHLKTKIKSGFKLKFILLSHFHHDHYSGMVDIFKFCIEKNIEVESFFHTITPHVGELLNRLNDISQNVSNDIKSFIQWYDNMDHLVGDKIPVHEHIKDVDLECGVRMIFLSPQGKTYDEIARKVSRRVSNVVSTREDINKLATILAFTNGKGTVLLTSDAVRKSFTKIRKLIPAVTILAQAPHHGSWRNIDIEFWRSLKRPDECPVVFSVGDNPADKLPDFETVEFIASEKYRILSTDSVYGISDFFKIANTTTSITSKALGPFSKKISTSTQFNTSDLQGEQVFEVFK